MRKLCRKRRWIICMFGGVFVFSGFADVIEGPFVRTSPYLRYQSPIPKQYNLKWGRVTGRLSGSLQLEYNDNINLADSFAEDDLAITPQVGFGVLWPLNKDNVLHFDFNVGYKYYVNHSSLSSLQVTPGSRLEHTIYIKDFKINIHDDVFLISDPLIYWQISGQKTKLVNYKRLENYSGLTVDWQPTTDVRANSGFDFKLSDSLTDDYKMYSHYSYIFLGGVEYDFAPKWTVGLDGHHEINDFWDRSQNDGTISTVGPKLIFRPKSFLTISAGFGLAYADYETQAGVNDTGTYSGLMFNFSVDHTLNSKMSHLLNFDRTVELGLGSNYYEVSRVQYSFNHKIASAVLFHLKFLFEDLKSSIKNGEKANRFMVYLGTSVLVSPNWRVGGGYSFALKDSNLIERDYLQNRFLLEITRSF